MAAPYRPSCQSRATISPNAITRGVPFQRIGDHGLEHSHEVCTLGPAVEQKSIESRAGVEWHVAAFFTRQRQIDASIVPASFERLQVGRRRDDHRGGPLRETLQDVAAYRVDQYSIFFVKLNEVLVRSAVASYCRAPSSQSGQLSYTWPKRRKG